jgi:hypothetical protein
MRASLAYLSLLGATLALPANAHAQEPLFAALPPGAPPAEETTPTTEMNSPALFVTGTVIAGLGLGTAAVGAAIYADDPPCDQGATAGLVPACGMQINRFFGLAMMGGGAGLALIGAPMIVAGAWQVDAEDQGVPPTTAELRVGATRADFTVSF